VFNLSDHFQRKWSRRSKMIDFVESLFADPTLQESEEDQLLLKRMKIKILSAYNHYRIQFLFVCFAIPMGLILKKNASTHLRVISVILMGPIAAIYQGPIGQMGVLNRADELFKMMEEK